MARNISEMLKNINRDKLNELGIGMFGVLSVTIIQTIIYQKLIMSPFKNMITMKSEYFSSEAGFIFLQKTIAWFFAQLIALCTLSSNDQIGLPMKDSVICGFLCFLSSILFTTGIFELSFRLSFSNHTSGYLIVTFIGLITSKYMSQVKRPKFRDLFSGFGIGLGIVLFWIEGQDFWVYTPTKNGYVYNWMIISSGIVDGFLGLLQAQITEKRNPHPIKLMLVVSRLTFICCLVYVLLIGDLRKTIDFCYFHAQFSLYLFMSGFLSSLANIFLYRVTTKMSQNVPAFITTSSQVLTIYQSYILSSHKIHTRQIIGMMISWISISLQALLFVKRQNSSTQTFSKIQFDQVQMSLKHNDQNKMQMN